MPTCVPRPRQRTSAAAPRKRWPADSLAAAIALPNASNEQLLEGTHATLRQLTAALEKNKVVAIAPPAGTKFDPHQHQAISVVPSEHEAGTVVAVLQKGYLIAERVLRPALVTVSAPK
jgi:molecular chaperone GrpE